MRTRLIVLPALLVALAGLVAYPIPANASVAAGEDLVVSGVVIEGPASYTRSTLNRASMTGVRRVPGAMIELDWVSNRSVSVGQTMRTVIIDTVTADANGNYALSATPTPEMLADATINDGWLNFTLVSLAGSRLKFDSLSRHWDGHSWTEYGVERPGMSPNDKREIIFATDTKTGNRNYTEATATVSQSIGANPDAPTCMIAVTGYTYNYTNVIEYHNSPDSDGHWEYGETADTDIDLGISYNGGTSYGAEGTVHVGNTGGGKIFGNTGALFGKYIATQFRYAHGYYSCSLK